MSDEPKTSARSSPTKGSSSASAEGEPAKASTERRAGPRTAFWVFCAMTLGLAAAIEDEDTVEP